MGNISDFHPHKFCQSPSQTESCDLSSVYRSYDGSCNNRRHVHWGAAYQPLRRVLAADYNNGAKKINGLPKGQFNVFFTSGISEPRRTAEGKALSSPRTISTSILKDMPGMRSNASLMFALWGQFVNHDIVSTAPSTGITSDLVNQDI